MDRHELERYIGECYGAEGEFPWPGKPGYEVFRHPDNRKWFAAIMGIPRERLGLADEGQIDVVNLKCDPLLAGELRQRPGIFPAYHMDKGHWITVALDGSVRRDELELLLEMSYDLTRAKRRAGGGGLGTRERN